MGDDDDLSVAAVVKLAPDKGARDMVLGRSIGVHPETGTVLNQLMCVQRLRGVNHGSTPAAERFVVGP